MLTIHMSNVQLVLVLDGFHYPTSAWPDTVWTRTVDRSLNIDKIRGQVHIHLKLRCAITMHQRPL